MGSDTPGYFSIRRKEMVHQAGFTSAIRADDKYNLARGNWHVALRSIYARKSKLHQSYRYEGYAK